MTERLTSLTVSAAWRQCNLVDNYRINDGLSRLICFRGPDGRIWSYRVLSVSVTSVSASVRCARLLVSRPEVFDGVPVENFLDDILGGSSGHSSDFSWTNTRFNQNQGVLSSRRVCMH